MFVAAVALVLAAGVLLFSSPASAQPLRVAPQIWPRLICPPACSRAAPPLPDGVEQDAALSPGPIIGLICAIVASSVALGIAFGLRRRIDRIAGPIRKKSTTTDELAIGQRRGRISAAAVRHRSPGIAGGLRCCSGYTRNALGRAGE